MDAEGCWFALQASRLGALPSISTKRCCSSKAEHAHGKRAGFSSILTSSSGGRESTCFGGVSSDGHHAGILLVRGQPSKLCIARFDPEYPLRRIAGSEAPGY